MRNVFALLLCCLCLLTLCACGQSSPAVETSAPAQTTEEPEPEAQPTKEPQHAVSLPGAALHEAEEAVETAYDKAKAFEKHPLQELIDVFGEPLSSAYAPSCLGSGQDGELSYDGFVVYTYRDESGENITGVSEG